MLCADKVIFALAYPSRELVAAMKNLLAALLLAPIALIAQENPSYDPDYNGDGCYSITDILGLLPLFGSCLETDTTWVCGDQVFYDNYWYETTQIGNQCWFAENLRYLPSVGLPSAHEGTPNATICGYQGDDFEEAINLENFVVYGALYNYSAVQEWSLCPAGWHVPSDFDWMQMESFLGMPPDELVSTDDMRGYTVGAHLALKDTEGWFIPGNNSSGFSGLPGGTSYSSNDFCSMDFPPQLSMFGTSTATDNGFMIRLLIDMGGNIGIPRFDVEAISLGGTLDHYFSVRCLKDTE